MKRFLLILIIGAISPGLFSQQNTFAPGGFIRSGLYYSTGGYDHDINAIFGDAALTIDISDNINFRGFADLRVRMGQQFGENVNGFNVREAWGSYYNNYFSISLGKKIIKWGKTDFFTPLSKFNPVDYSFRSPEREDSDLGNLMAEFTVTPASFIKISAVVSPLWNPSILMTRPLKLPDNIRIELPEELMSANGYNSFGLRSDFVLKGLDAGIQYFHGPDLMPGLTLVSADFTNPMNPEIVMLGVPYLINSAGVDFESSVSSFILRGTLAYSKPVKTKGGNEEVPFPQAEWVAGIDWTPGVFRIAVEYSGKKVFDYYQAPYNPLIGTEPDYAALAALFSTPGFDPVEFARLQTEAFNRLYNNQLKEYYHSIGLRIEAETFYGKLIPSLTGIYNFTSRDLVVLPSIKYKPAGAVTLSAGIEYYSGRKGGMYAIIDDFMNTAFVSLRIDF